ncbi:MAG TPA: 6-pyruvoyl-tetrahydropterin synthase-related protein, partial [Longimicrobiales bacterium]|nr:6-pyruvoyl-tetrahydropterin synthase-related protein [Longimicrobiales bacterium]
MARKAPARQSPAGDTRVTQKPRDISTGWLFFTYFALALVYFLPAFLPGRHIYGTDYTQAGYMMYEFARQQIAAGTLPKWVPYILGGLPMFANPGSVYHPVRLLANLVLPGAWILPTLFVLQFGIAGAGMFLLTRELGCRKWVAFIAGLAFQFTGITLSAVYAGHDGRVIVATMAPLFLFLLHRGVRTGSVAAFAGMAATVGLALLSFQIQSNYYLLLAGMAWAVFALVHFGIVRTPRALARRTALGLGAVAFGFMLAAVNFLPFMEYVPDSPRGVARGYEYSTSWALPPVEVLGLFVPEHTGVVDTYRGTNPFKLNTEYAGALVFILLILGLAVSRRNRHWWFFLGLSLVALTFAFGGHTPIYRLYYDFLPGTKSFRAPSIVMFLVSLALVAMAAITLERIAQLRVDPREGTGPREPERAARFVGWLLGAATLIALAAAGVAAATNSFGASGFARFAFFTAATCLLLWLWWAAALRTGAFVVLLALVTMADLLVINRNFFTTVVAPSRMFAQDALIGSLVSAPQPSRVWILPSPDGTESNVLMLFGVEQAGGEHGNQLQRYNEYVGVGEDTYVDWHNLINVSNYVNAASIRFVLSRSELDLRLVGFRMRLHHQGGGWVYENLDARPRAYLASDIVAMADTMGALEVLRDSTFDVATRAVVYSPEPLALPATPHEGSVDIIEHTPDRVVLRAQSNRPALLVLADNWHKDWTATVNGADVPILRTNHTFRGVMVNTGASDVVFEFRPRALQTGFYLYLLGMALLLG